MDLLQLKSLGIVSDDARQLNRNEVGTLKDLFKGWKLIPVKNNTKVDRATLVFLSPDGKSRANIIVSPALTKLWREDKVDVATLAGMPVVLIDKDSEGNAINPRLSLGVSGGAIEVDKIVVKTFNPQSVAQYETLA